MSELKREALISTDLETLRLIRSFEGRLQIFFKRENEDFIRNNAGTVIDIPYSIFEQIVAFRPHRGQIVDLEPGSLINRIKSDKIALVIIELPESTPFPVEPIENQVRVSNDLSVISGIGFYQVTPDLAFIRTDDLSEDQIDDLLRINDHLDSE